MSTYNATGAPSGADTSNDNLPAVRPVTITADPIEVRTRAPRRRTVTSGTPIVGNVTPAPPGQSWLDRAVRRFLVELVRTGLWVAGVVAMIGVNLTLGLAAAGALVLVEAVSRVRRRRRAATTRLAVVEQPRVEVARFDAKPRGRTEVDRLAVSCDQCAAVTARPTARAIPTGWFRFARARYRCPRCCCGGCGAQLVRQPDGSAPDGWFHQITKARFLCPTCTRGAAAATVPFWTGGDQ